MASRPPPSTFLALKRSIALTPSLPPRPRPRRSRREPPLPNRRPTCCSVPMRSNSPSTNLPATYRAVRSRSNHLTEGEVVHRPGTGTVEHPRHHLYVAWVRYRIAVLSGRSHHSLPSNRPDHTQQRQPEMWSPQPVQRTRVPQERPRRSMACPTTRRHPDRTRRMNPRAPGRANQVGRTRPGEPGRAGRGTTAVTPPRRPPRASPGRRPFGRGPTATPSAPDDRPLRPGRYRRRYEPRPRRP